LITCPPPNSSIKECENRGHLKYVNIKECENRGHLKYVMKIEAFEIPHQILVLRNVKIEGI